MRRLGGPGDGLRRGGGGGGGPRGGGGADQLDPSDQGGAGAGEAPLRHRDPHDQGRGRWLRAVHFRVYTLEISAVISEMATWSQAQREDGIWAMGDARWSDENCSVSVENNKTGN